MEFDLGSALEAVEHSANLEEWDDIEPDSETETPKNTAIQPRLLPAPLPHSAFDFLPKFLRPFFGNLEDLAALFQDNLAELEGDESSAAPAEAYLEGGEGSTALVGSRPAKLTESQREKKRHKTSRKRAKCRVRREAAQGQLGTKLKAIAPQSPKLSCWEKGSLQRTSWSTEASGKWLSNGACELGWQGVLLSCGQEWEGDCSALRKT
ncbi:hypothetical protein BDP27DRAFT_1434756 [Rhodocollybia butyracea]|uniref:Uncharacterized protein n=1 Tax=Rhodocollybia butyracea TaxID=206335 RepID=A0A9P5P5Y5_9AGAR|nr:hypothetical protein BDP27DRAFT_1434756 [Rhodocollybia butyracea]